MLPVVNPNSQMIPPQQIRDIFQFDALITNSYLVWRKHREETNPPKIHELLKFNGVIETDSGAYQILQYGDIEVQPSEIIRFQEQLDTDIAVILDVPTGDETTKERAKWTVEETLRRADQSLQLISRSDMLWVGPVQGGIYVDLVKYSAKEMAKRNFSIYALGSPTPVMQRYRFDILVDMIMAAKTQLPPSKPLHLFGAGHPMMFAFAVALGCDIFDSASYALFARNGRYMTAQGTAKLEELEYFPCNCTACHGKTPEDVRKLLRTDRERFLASHNLHACFAELQTIKQAIVDGRLWELVEARAGNHPTLQKAFQRILTYTDYLELGTPVRKRKGPFLLSEQSLNRPEVIRYQKRLLERYAPPPRIRRLLLLPEGLMRPFRENPTQNDLISRLEKRKDLHLCSYGLAFGIVPHELVDVYPLSQTENAISPNPATINHARKCMVKYLKKLQYSHCVMLGDEDWEEKTAEFLKKTFKRKMKISYVQTTKLDIKFIRQVLKVTK
jgi:7-cyano-7-deazaguanine tRNA-ribosyltransferase